MIYACFCGGLELLLLPVIMVVLGKIGLLCKKNCQCTKELLSDSPSQQHTD